MDRHTHLHHRPSLRVLERHHHAVVDHLRIRHAVLGQARRRERHVRGLERFGPFRIRLRAQDSCQHVAQLRVLFRAGRPPAVEPRLRDHVADAHQTGRDGDKTGMDAAELHPVAVRAFVDAVERRAAGRVGLKDVTPQMLAGDFRMIEQRTRHQRGFDGAAAAGLLARQQRRRNADIRQDRRAGARQRMHHVNRCGAKSRHAAEHAHPGKHQIVDRRLVLERPLLAIGRDRAMHQARVNPRKPFGSHQALAVRARRKIFHQDIGARHQPLEERRCRVRRRSSPAANSRPRHPDRARCIPCRDPRPHIHRRACAAARDRPPG